MNLYNVNDTDDFNGENGLELSIRKWQSIVEALGERLSAHKRRLVCLAVGAPCGLCLQYKCIDCVLTNNESCGDEYSLAASNISDYRFDDGSKSKALTAAKAMLNKLKSLEGR